MGGEQQLAGPDTGDALTHAQMAMHLDPRPLYLRPHLGAGRVPHPLGQLTLGPAHQATGPDFSAHLRDPKAR